MNQYMSIKTGEIVVGFSNVIKTALQDFKMYHILNFRWAKFPPEYFD